MKKRQLSTFMTQELLFDFAMGHLDPERRRLVQEEIEKAPHLQEDLDRIRMGLKYWEQLSDTELSKLLLESVGQRATYWSQLKKTFSIENWPPFVKWTLEAVSVVTFVILISLLAPWAQVKEIVMQESRKEVILAEIPKSAMLAPHEAPQTTDKNEMGKFEDESAGAMTPPTQNPTNAVSTTKTAQTDSAAKTVSESAAAAASKADDSRKKGFVYRGTLSVVNVEANASKLKDKIVELGGRKAGEVELGWRRNQGDYYFHFTIPESKFADLEDYFKGLGVIKMSRDPHPRIMPDGIIRLIITAEEK
ncbi:MAG: hypothetical protein ACK5Y2_07110 [Bdellovibrionales bacterium]